MQEDIRNAIKVLKEGGIILYPTDTIWGLGCDATNPEAVARLYEIKRRVDSKAMLSLVSGEGMLQRYVDDIPEIAWELIDAAVKPLTIIYDHPVHIAKNLLAEDGSCGIRITSEPFSQRLCHTFNRPIVSTSANISGKKAPSTFHEISSEIKKAVDYVVKYGHDYPASKSSNIIKLSDGGVISVIR